jgi:hypothetical protein
MLNGWIKLHRRILDNGLFSEAELLKVFIWCLLKANRKTSQVNGIPVKVGQFITGRISASEELYMKPSTVYVRLKKLKRMKYIDMQTTNKFTMISVVKYNQYQVEDKKPKVDLTTRRAEFLMSVDNHINEYPKDMLQQFVDYWTEPNKSKTKMKFELQRTWDTKRRLETWKRNSKTMGKTEKPNILNTWAEARNIMNNG